MANDVFLGLVAIGEMGMLAGEMTSFESTEVFSQQEKFRVWKEMLPRSTPRTSQSLWVQLLILGIGGRVSALKGSGTP